MSMDPMLQAAERYVGIPYLEGEFDCADLAARVQWELFDHVIELPVHRARPVGSSAQAREIHKRREALATQIDAAVTGCAVLMFEPGPTAPIWHIGTVFLSEGVVWVLHNSAALGAAWLQRLPDMQRQGMRLDGFYAWR